MLTDKEIEGLRQWSTGGINNPTVPSEHWETLHAALTELQSRRAADATIECTNPEKCTCACGDIARATTFVMDTRLGGE